MARWLPLLFVLLLGCAAHGDKRYAAAERRAAERPDAGKERTSMAQTWQYQVRMNVSQELADAYREKRDTPQLARLYAVLAAHRATFISQYDAFAGYVAEAEREGVDGYPLYQWTLDTIGNPDKQAKYQRVFTVYVEGRDVYGEDVADALRADLSKLGEPAGILGVTKLDTNPANSPQPPGTRGHRQ